MLAGDARTSQHGDAETLTQMRSSSADEPQPPRFGVVVLTQGKRPAELCAALDSLLAQQGVELDVVCVGNGWEPTGLPSGVKPLCLPENRGIPAGRNAGVAEVAGELLFFLDDDALLPDPRFLATIAQRFAEHPRLGLLQPRVVAPDAESPPRWIPRVRKGDPARSGPAFSVWEGAVATRRKVFEAAGQWPGEFFYAHEGIELAWRIWDQDAIVWYAGDLVVNHPAIDPARHDFYYRLNARNRIWLARRNLPAPLRPLYVGSWTAVQILRSLRNRATLRPWFAGWREGWTTDPGTRRPMSWRTIARMTRHGRPPII